MALSLDTIFKPLNEFFIKLLQTGVDSPVMFRFDKFGSVINEQDFIDPNHPELGCSPNRATEMFSDLVNHIPSDTGDGMSIVFRQDAIDDAYFFRMLSPAQPCVSGDSPDNQSIIDAFSAIKADAVKVWQNLKLESSSGLMFQFKPSLAKPEKWYDKSSADIWTHQTFSITAPGNQPPPPPVTSPLKFQQFNTAGVRTNSVPVLTSPQRPQLWRLKLNDAALTSVLQSDRVQLSDSTQRVLMKRTDQLSPKPAALELTPKTTATFSAQTARVSSPIAHSAAVNSTALNARSIGGANLIRGDAVHIDPAPASTSFVFHDAVNTQIAELNVSERLQLVQVIRPSAPAQPAVTDSVSISFDYCLINIRRPWYVDAFINDSSWFVPGSAKDSITTGVSGNSFLHLPIAFVAIKNLVIEADWAAADIATATNATDFGPFKVTSGIVQNKLSHEGIQVIGWLLQNMPNLPPKDPPN